MDNPFIKPVARALFSEDTTKFLSIVQDQFRAGTWSYISVHNKATGSIFTKSYRHDQRERTLGLHRFATNRDIYVTANGFNGKGRRSNTLFSLHNIVIDIDNHSGGIRRSLIEKQQDNLVQELLHNDDEDLLIPNIIVATGRGLQLWFTHVPLSAQSNRWTWDGVVRRLCDKIESVIENSPEDPYEGCRYLKVDRTASMNPAGLFRLPGTKNMAVRKTVCYTVVSSHRYTLAELKAFAAAHKLPSHRQTYKVAGDIPAWAVGMMDKLASLRSARDSSVGEETRNNYCFAYYCMANTAGNDDSTSWELLNRFNSGFKKPMTERELLRCTVTARRKEYKLSMRKIIAMLGISEEEIDEFGFTSGTKTAEKMHLRRKRVQEKALLEKAVIRDIRAGATYAELMQKHGISRQRLLRIVNNNHLPSPTVTGRIRRNERIIALRKNGYTEPEIARMVGCGRTTVQSVLRQHREDEVAAAVAAENPYGAFFKTHSLESGLDRCNNVYLKGLPGSALPVLGKESPPCKVPVRGSFGAPALACCPDGG